MTYYLRPRFARFKNIILDNKSMAEIKLTGYEAVVPNYVYKRSVGLFKLPYGFGETPSTEILQFSRIRAPRVGDVVKYVGDVSKKAPLLKTGLLLPVPEDEMFLLKFICQLPKGELEEIIHESEDAMDHLARHYPDDKYQEGREYLSFASGVVPDIELELNLERWNKDPDIYDTVIDKIGLNELRIDFLLSEGGYLPDKNRMDYLMKRKARNSKLFWIREYDSYGHALNAINLLYDSTNGDFSPAIDKSHDFFMIRCLHTVGRSVACSKVRSGIFGIMGLTSIELSGRGEHPRGVNRGVKNFNLRDLSKN